MAALVGVAPFNRDSVNPREDPATLPCATGRLATDLLDAAVIAHFVEAVRSCRALSPVQKLAAGERRRGGAS